MKQRETKNQHSRHEPQLKRVAEASVEAHIEQQSRSASKIETIEEEHRKISRELHDRIGIPDGYRTNNRFRSETGLNNIKERPDLHGGRLKINSQKILAQN